jgi:hypothetical protein
VCSARAQYGANRRWRLPGTAAVVAASARARTPCCRNASAFSVKAAEGLAWSLKTPQMRAGVVISAMNKMSSRPNELRQSHVFRAASVIITLAVLVRLASVPEVGRHTLLVQKLWASVRSSEIPAGPNFTACALSGTLPLWAREAARLLIYGTRMSGRTASARAALRAPLSAL